MDGEELYRAQGSRVMLRERELLPDFTDAILNACRIAVRECKCKRNIEWTWADVERADFVDLVNNNADVRFHQNYSAGTAVVRGTLPMSENQYFWEVKMISPVYGTDIMIGVGTSEADISQIPDRFISLLGMDNKTWGLSYTGLFHHSGESRNYATGFGLGSVIGVHLDLWNGTLSFYKNRKHLGIASTGLKGKTLYAMASSTAARSGMRILRTCSFPSSLLYLCCSRLRELISDDKRVLDVIDIPPGLRLFLENNLGWLLDQRYAEDSASHCCKQNSKVNCDESTVVDEALFGNADAQCSNYHTQPFVRQTPCIIVSSAPCIMHNLNRFQGQSSTRNGRTEDDHSFEESNGKRRRCSYNYVMGLSDPDSD